MQKMEQDSLHSEADPLLDRQNKTCPEKCWISAKGMCFGNPFQDRNIWLNGAAGPGKFAANRIKNTKYNVVTFIPIVLFNQFKYFFNLFFLMIALSQFYKPLRVGFLITYLFPVAFVLFLTMIKEAYDDILRWKRDKEMNNARYEIMNNHGNFEGMSSADLKVGNIVRIQAGMRIPADLILIYASEKGGSVFIKTDQLDGETDWKLRRAINYTQQAYTTGQNLIGLGSRITVQAAHKDIYRFQGVFYADPNNPNYVREPLSLDNTLWANTVLTSGVILGQVLYTGAESRMQMNSRNPRSKVSKLDLEVNRMAIIMFLVLVTMAFLLILLNGFHYNWHILFFRFVLLLSAIIPISLRVNLDLAKIWYSYLIYHDKEMPDSIVRNSNIPEDLGRIQYLFSDKTGTLTQNCMEFKRLSVDDTYFDMSEGTEELERMVKAHCRAQNGPMADVQDARLSSSHASRLKKRKHDAIIRDFITSLALCHSVTPVIENGLKVYQASSPDEIALVKFAESLNMKLLERDPHLIKIQNSAGNIEEYDILAVFPFSSETKKMGIVVRHKETNRIIFYLKGAEIVMGKKMSQSAEVNMNEACEYLAMDGLRTLVIGQRYLEEEEFMEWQVSYQEAQASMHERDTKVMNSIQVLESDMELLGVTGVEDKLQRNVQATVKSLKEAGISIWMLTGDKVETAKCIAISSGLKQNIERFFPMHDLPNDRRQITLRLRNLDDSARNSILVIDGSSLEHAMAECEDLFFTTAAKAKGVICCRCSPTQKTAIVKRMKELTKKRCAAIGDGGNDVGMILEGDVGVGIVGKEGKQASLAADFSITEFGHLNRLLLWHGRLSYKRSASLSQFIVHRGLLISVIQFVFSMMFYFCAIPVYNSYLMLGYCTYYTFLPVYCLVFDEDLDVSEALAHPALYASLQKGRAFSFKTFITWVAQSIYQGSVIMLCAITLFSDSFVNIVIITFSALILIELLNVATQLHKHIWQVYLCLFLSFCVYALSILLLHNYFQLRSVNGLFFVKILLIVAIAWLPIHILKYIIEKIDPDDFSKIKKGRL